MTARCASHWSGNSMIESIEDCVSAAQQSNTMRDADNLENLMSFEGMLKSK
jgi:polyphosphate kinase 2 (PPK2 family)